MPELRERYEIKANLHNADMMNTHYNSGFDLLFSQDQRITDNFTTTFINLNVKAEMSYIERSRTNPCNCVVNSNTVANTDGTCCWGNTAQTGDERSEPCGFFVFPRSSMSKTPLILANHTGIIDSSYRGNLMVAVRKCPAHAGQDDAYDVEMFERLFQITHPSLCRVFVVMVKETDLSDTARDVGGFGSTGRF
jgi:dUTP pyrophosphatase